MKNIPKINIRHGRLLEPFFKDYILNKYPDHVFFSEEEVLEKVDVFEKTFSERGNEALKRMYEITGLEFKKNIIDVFIVNATNRDMSAPLIIRARYTPNEFVEILIHELVHVLLTDNKFPIDIHPDPTVAKHIPVYKVLKEMGYMREPKDPKYKLAYDLADGFVF